MYLYYFCISINHYPYTVTYSCSQSFALSLSSNESLKVSGKTTGIFGRPFKDGVQDDLSKKEGAFIL